MKKAFGITLFIYTVVSIIGGVRFIGDMIGRSSLPLFMKLLDIGLSMAWVFACFFAAIALAIAFAEYTNSNDTTA